MFIYIHIEIICYPKGISARREAAVDALREVPAAAEKGVVDVAQYPATVYV